MILCPMNLIHLEVWEPLNWIFMEGTQGKPLCIQKKKTFLLLEIYQICCHEKGLGEAVYKVFQFPWSGLLNSVRIVP